jgi:predicted nucleotidyltransferase
VERIKKYAGEGLIAHMLVRVMIENVQPFYCPRPIIEMMEKIKHLPVIAQRRIRKAGVGNG